MNEFKGTPGPWTGLQFHECIAICQQDDADLRLGFVSSPNPERMAEGRANAFLIAAAPELLGSVQSLVEELEKYQHTPHPEGSDGARDYLVKLMIAKAALRKALGEKP